MPLGDYVEGLAFLAVVLGGVLGAAALLVVRRLAHLTGAARALAFALIATTALIGVHLLPGIFGVLSRWTVAAVALVLLAAAWRIPPGASGAPDPAPAAERESGTVSWVLAFAAAGVLALWSLATAWNRTVLPFIGSDTTAFHLPNVAGWIQDGSFWRIDQFLPLLANGNYPHNGDVVFLAVVLPWRNDAFTPLVNPVFLGLAALAVYAIAHELRAPRATSVLFAAVLTALPSPVIGPAYFETMTDPILLATFGAGVFFLLRHARTERRSDLVLGGLGLGLAFGTKWYGVSAVAVVLLVWLGAWLLARRRTARVAGDGLLLGAAAAAAGGFWLVRNLVESSNPLQPVNVEVAGVTLFDAPPDVLRECAGHTVAGYVSEPDVFFDGVVVRFWDSLGLAAPLLFAAFLAALVLAIRALRAREPDAGRSAAVVACAALLFGAYSVTPYSAFGPEGDPFLIPANVRYGLPALMLACALAAWAAGRLGRALVVVEVFAAAAVIDGMRREFEVEPHVVAGVLAGLAALALAGWAGALLTGRLPARWVKPARVGAAAVALVALVAVGHERQKQFNEDRYAAEDPAFEAILREAPGDHKIALAGVPDTNGVFPALPALGPRLENEVDYLGPTVDGQLREYDDRRAWAAALRDGGYDYLIVGRGGYSGCGSVPGEETDDDAWARTEGLDQVTRSDRLTLYRVN